MDFVKTNAVVAADLPFSEAIVSNGFVFVSGQVAIDPRTGEARPGDISTETELTLTNLKRVLEAAGTDLGHVVKCSVYLRDINDFGNMNEVYIRTFGGHKPTRTTVQALLIEPFRVEVDAIAELPRGTPPHNVTGPES